LFGGSEGGVSDDTAALLASHGYPSLALEYFTGQNDPPIEGIPQALLDIPLEYFAGALAWLEKQPGVDPTHTFVYAYSRGSEAALLLGVHYPDLVHGVIALVPSNVANYATWTLQRNRIPFTLQFGNPYPTDNPAAQIPVEMIRGPIFLDCGGADTVWHSCKLADAITARLVAHHDAYQHILLTYPDAGHLSDLPPYYPGREIAIVQGRSPEANDRAREQAWPRLLDFLAANSR